jgi:hypothetical protein
MMINKLNKILATWGTSRLELVRQFQEEIWNGSEYEDDDPIYEILDTLAVDLDYYEPNLGWRMEDKSFYGDDRLKVVILSAIKELESLRNIENSIPMD